MKNWLVSVLPFLLWTCCTSQNVCEEPPDIDFGEMISDEKARYLEGDRTQYKCNPGYVLEGTEWIICRGQKWTPAPRCLAPCGITKQQLDAKDLLLPGKRRRSQVIQHNHMLQFLCKEGHVITAPSVRKCIDGHMDLPSCISEMGENCSHTPTIENGDIITLSQKQYASGSSVEFKCQKYYAMEGENRTFCNNGNWTKVPICLEPCAISLAEMESKKVEVVGQSDEHHFQNLYVQRGTSVELACKPGHAAAANNSPSAFVIRCNGEAIVYPECAEVTCNPPKVANGTFRPRRNIYHGEDLIQIQCDSGFHLADGQNIAECTRNGWSPLPQCSKIVCSPPQVENGNFQPKQIQYEYQDTIETQCEPGYQLQNHQVTSTCTETGWSPPPICVPKNCDYFQIENGQLSDTYERWRNHYFPRRVGQTVDYSCRDGFQPRNKETWHRISCTKLGWSPEPKCFKKCYIPRQLAHGTFNAHTWQNFIEGEEISFSCDDGYVPANQEAKAICTKNGWSPAPRCNIRKICGLKEPPNGFFTERKNRYNLNDKISYRCQPGFATPQGREMGDIQCHEEGWKPEPKCIKTCQVPTQNNEIFNTSQSVFLFKEILHYKCKDGFETIKKATGDHVVCTENGWSPKPECLPIHCDGFLLENGLLDPRNNQYQHRDVVKFSCRRGYTRVGPNSAQCYHFGWSPQPPTCKAQVNPCQPPPGILYGSISGDLQEEYEHGEKVECKCNFGFAVTGSKLIECLDGQWTSLPLCKEEPRTCEVPPNIRNGRPVSVDSDRYLHGETVAYECNESYSIVGTKEAVCLHGQWELPLCVDVAAKCTRPQNAEFVPYASHARKFKHNDVVTYTCGSTQHKTKCVNGKWSPEPECTAFCPPPPQLPNAIDITDTRNYKNGEEISFRCQENFLLQGPQKIKCENGKWQTPPRCFENSCGRPPYLVDAAYEGLIKNRYEPGDILPFNCAPGYATEGPRNITCQKGKWSEASTCEDATCGEPPAVAGAEIVAGTAEVYLPDHEVHYQCHEGFEISGSANVTCQNKEWSEPPTCVDLTCPPPPRISNGEVTTGLKQRYLPLEKVRYRCRQGYSLFGAFTVKCVNKEWTASPRCIDAAGNCGPLPPIENGDFLGTATSEYMPGARVQYKCQALYNMQGNAYVRCENGHWTDTPTCIEPCTATEEDMNQNNIRLKWKYDKKIYSASGDVEEFACKWGFQPDPSSPPFRAPCREGKLEYPRCIRRQQK